MLNNGGKRKGSGLKKGQKLPKKDYTRAELQIYIKEKMSLSEWGDLLIKWARSGEFKQEAYAYEQVHGRPTQTTELSGIDGGAININNLNVGSVLGTIKK